MARGPVVVDIDVFSAHLIVNPLLARRNEPLPAGRGEIISYQTVTELHDGVHLDGWGRAVFARLNAAIDAVEVVHTGDELIDACTHNARGVHSCRTRVASRTMRR